MNGLHASAEIVAGSTARFAKLVDHMLAQLTQRIRADADKKTAHLFIRGQPAKKIIRDRRDRIVTTEALVQRRRGAG